MTGGSTDWGAMMAAAQAGDRRCYEQLLREILPYVRSVVRRHHADSGRAEDVVQDVLLTIHRVRHTYDPARPFAAWLAAIAQRRSIDALRRKIRTESAETYSPIAYETFADPQANREIAAHEDGAVLGEAIAALPPGQRQAVELLRLRELSLAEAALESGQSVGALKVSLHRAIKALQKIAGGRNGENGRD